MRVHSLEGTRTRLYSSCVSVFASALVGLMKSTTRLSFVAKTASELMYLHCRSKICEAAKGERGQIACLCEKTGAGRIHLRDERLVSFCLDEEVDVSRAHGRSIERLEDIACTRVVWNGVRCRHKTSQRVVSLSVRIEESSIVVLRLLFILLLVVAC